jgi:hypothetical protein
MYETDVVVSVENNIFKMSDAETTSIKLITTMSGINQNFIIYYTYSANDNNIK